MKKRLLSWLLCAAMVIGLLPAMAITTLADELAETRTLSDDYISVSVSKKNGGFTVRTVEGDRLKKSDNNKKLLYHDGQYDTSFLSFRVGTGSAAKDYIFGGKYPGSSGVAVTEENGAIKAVWSVDGLTFTQSISLTNTSSNESGMVSLSLSVANGSGAAVPVQTRILYDTALGEQDFGYYQYNDTSTQKTETISMEKVLTGGIPRQLFATDDPYSPSVAAYSVNNDRLPTKVAFGHWSHLASTLFDFTPVETLDFTNTRNEYMTADSAYALYFDLGSVAAGGSTSLNTYYGVFSNHKTPASDSVAVNLTAPVRLKLNGKKTDFVPESGVKGSAHFAVTVDFTNIAGEGAQDLSNVLLAVQSSRNLCSLTDEGGAAAGQGYEAADPFTIPYAELKVGESKTKTLYFKAKVGTDAAYERITVGIYNGTVTQENKLGERMAYVLLPGSDGDVPKVSFAAMTPKIIYTEGTRHLFVTVTNDTLLGNTANWDLKVYSEDGKVSVAVPHENITIKDGIMDVALTEDIRLSEGGWYLQLEWTDAAVSANIVTADKKLQTAPELHFTVSADKKYKNDAYGVLAVVEYKNGSNYSHQIVSFKSEDDFNQFKNDTIQYEEILLTFKGEFTKKTVNGKDHYIAASTKKLVDGKHEVDNPIVINGCMDFEGGSLEVYYDTANAICTEFDGDLYTNTERTSIWKGKAILTKIEMGTNYSLIPYNENGERGSYESYGSGERKLNTDAPQNFTDKPITLIWPNAAGIGQTLSGMIFKMAYAQLGIMYDTENQTNKIEETIGCVVSFTAALDLTFASGKVDENATEPPTYWSELTQLWSSYNDLKSGSLYNYVYGSSANRFEQALDWSDIDEDGGKENEKNIKGSVMVRDVLFGCGEGFIGVNFEVGVAIKNYISGLPEIEGTIAVSTINDWAFGVDGKIKLANFTVEAKVSFKSKNNIPIPDELYVFVSGFEPGLNIDGCGVIWLTGAGGGIKNIYDSIFMTQAVPPLKLLLSVSFDVVKVLTCEKATLSLGLTGISLQAENIGIKKIESLKAIEKMGLSLEWYPGIDLRANIVVNLFDGVIYGGGYIVLLSPDYKDVFFEMFARAKLNVPGSVPIVGGMTLAGIDLGISTEKVWGALDVLFITLGVTYYWGEGSVDFSKGSKSNPTFPDLLGYDDLPVYYDAERDQTLYARVGTNTQIMATSLPNDGGLTLMATGAELHCTEGNSKTAYWFNLGQRQNEADAIVQITFDASDMADAKAKAATIKVGSTNGGNDYGLKLFDTTKDQHASENQGANANLSYDAAAKKATYAFTATKAEQYGKQWYMSTPEGSDVILYNVSEVPKVETVSGAVNGSKLILAWDGSELSELDQISFYLCKSNDSENTDPGYRVGVVDSDLVSKSATLAIPADVPTGSYYIRAVYSKSDEVNGVAFSGSTVHWTNSNTPGAASFTAKAAGNLQYAVTIPQDANTDGYLVTIYNANGTATDFQQVSYDAAASGNTVIHVGGRYTAMAADGNTQEFGLTGGRTYTIGVTPYKKVSTSNNGVVGETAVYGAEVKETCALPEMVTPTVTFSADKAVQSRTETQQDKAGKTYTAKKSVYTSNALTITAKVSEAVTGTWKLDSAESSTPFSSTASISIPLASLTEGEHTLTLEGAAADGDSFAATYTFTVDTLPPQLLLSSPVNGSFFDKNGTLIVTGVTDADARFTLISNGTPICEGKTLTSSEFNPVDGTFSFSVTLPDPNSASQHDLTITVADDVGNATAPQSVTVSHGGLADLVSLEVMVNGQAYSSGNLPIPAAGLQNVPLTLVGVTSNGTKFNLTGYNVSWDLTTVEGTASLSDRTLTAALGSQGIITGKLAVANGAYRTASLCFGALANHIVAVSATIGGSVTGGGEYNGGETVTLTAVPDSGYRFTGWTVTGASVADLTAATITFTMPQAGNVTALASFAPVSSSGGSGGSGGSDISSESVSAKAGEIVRVKLPAGKSEEQYLPCYTDDSGTLALVPISALIDGYVTFLAPKSGTYRFISNPVAFSDTANHWAAESIAFCAMRELFKGVGDGRFAPDAPMTRAMFATVLYRIAGMPAVNGTNSFYDVAAGQWYTNAILWGQSTGIINGYGNGFFGTNDLVTREQMCVMLSRYLQWAGYELQAAAAAKQFSDNAQIADWAAESVRFCQIHGLINGRPNGLFAPKANATRAENSAVLRRVILAILSSFRNR